MADNLYTSLANKADKKLKLYRNLPYFPSGYCVVKHDSAILGRELGYTGEQQILPIFVPRPGQEKFGRHKDMRS